MSEGEEELTGAERNEPRLLWGVRVAGSVVICEDRSAARLLEKQLRERGREALMVTSADGGVGWRDVLLIDSAGRGDPVPPGPRRVWWWERWRGGGVFRPSERRGRF